MFPNSLPCPPIHRFQLKTSLFRSTIVAGALSAAVASAASASFFVPPSPNLRFNYSGTADGTLGGVRFAGKAFTFTGLGNTQNRVVFNNALFVGHSITHSSTALSIEGFAAVVVTSQMATVSSALIGQNRVSLSLAPTPAVAKFIFSIAAPTWNMTGALSGGAGSTTFNSGSSGIPVIHTSLGELRFTSIGSPATFSATAVPAPGAAALIGLVGAVGARRRRA